MPRRKGSVNYKNDVLIQIISEILPNGEYGWNAVATAYQNISKEEAFRTLPIPGWHLLDDDEWIRLLGDNVRILRRQRRWIRPSLKWIDH